MSLSTASQQAKTLSPTGRGSTARGSRVGQIYQNILKAVVEQRLPPGTKLIEEQLGAVFGVSRTLVRSALQALAHEHIVTLAYNRGAFVSAPTVEDARDLFATRKLVECAIAREAAAHIQPTQISSLRALLTKERAALDRGDRGAAIRLSGAFHVEVAATSGEGALTAFLRSLVSRSSLVIALYGRSHASACGHDEHSVFLAALESQDGKAAARLMARHLDHIFGDLDLTSQEGGPVDVAAILKAKGRSVKRRG